MTKGRPHSSDILAECRRLGRTATDEQAAALARYLRLLASWNAKINLVGPHEWQDIFRHLVADSFYLEEFVRSLPLPDQPLALDLGSGAGLPGIPLRILWQQGRYWLTETRGKRAVFLRTALAELSLPRTEVFHGPGQEALARLQGSGAADGRAKGADLIVARAFLPWPRLLDFARPLLKGPQAEPQAGTHDGTQSGPQATPHTQSELGGEDPGRDGGETRPAPGRVLVLAAEPPPDEADLPPVWTLEAAASYPVEDRQRYLWALAPR